MHICTYVYIYMYTWHISESADVRIAQSQYMTIQKSLKISKIVSLEASPSLFHNFEVS